MAGVESRDFDSPDESRTPDKTQVNIVRMGNTTVGRFSFEPGWRWSDCVKPVAGTHSRQARPVGVVEAGRLVGRPDDGLELQIGAGNACTIEPPHATWAVGREGFLGYEPEQQAPLEYATKRD